MLTIRNDGTASKNHLYNIYERLNTTNTLLKSARDNISELINAQELANSRISQLINRVTAPDASEHVRGVFDYIYDRLGDISKQLSSLGASSPSSTLESFLGSFDMPVSSALSAKVSAAMQSAFPFCIPAIFKQVLGLMEVEAAPASFDFEFMGAACTLDFSAGGFATGIAEVTRWVCRILFVVVLLACTPRFILTMPQKGG